MEFSEAMDLFEEHMNGKDRSDKTIIGYRRDLKMVMKHLSLQFNTQIFVDDIQTSDIEAYLLMLKEEKQYKAGSRNRHLNSLKSFYKFCHREGWVQTNPVASIDKIRGQQKEREILEINEVGTFIQSIEHPLVKVVTQCLYYAGLRISECLDLKMSEVDLEKRQIRVINGKGNKDRNVPINQRLLAILKEYQTNQRVRTTSPYFFATKRSGRLSNVYVNRVLDKTRQKLGWQKRVSAHTLRHSFASHLIRKGVNIVDIQKMLGHADLKTTSIYMHTNQEALLESVDHL